MSVLKGEGSVPILFNTTSISVRSLTHTAYLARPDLTGEWPTVVVLPSEWGLTGAMKDLTRRLARHGIAAICPDVYAGTEPDRSATNAQARAAANAIPLARLRRDLNDIVDFITNPTGHWSSAEDGFGVLGVGMGGWMGIELARSHPGSALVLVGTPLIAADVPLDTLEPSASDRPASGSLLGHLEDPMERMRHVAGPVMGMYGRDDEAAVDVLTARKVAPHVEWVMYDDVGADFLDDGLDGYDLMSQRDAIERMSEFFTKHLPTPR